MTTPTIRALIAHNAARVKWETEVTEALARRWDTSYGDASGFMDCHASDVDDLHSLNLTPQAAAEALDSL